VPTLTAADQWPDSPIWSAPSIKPLDADEIVTICRRHAAVVVLEEHSVYGGLASAVAEIAAAHCPTWICPIRVPDPFSAKAGSPAYLRRDHGLAAASIVERVKEFLARMPAEVAPQPARRHKRPSVRAA